MNQDHQAVPQAGRTAVEVDSVHSALTTSSGPLAGHRGGDRESAPIAEGSALDVEQMIAGLDLARQIRAERMPTEQDAIREMFSAWLRLKELGWRDGQYMPATGERFAGIQCGSTGIHAYTAERPEGTGRAATMYMLHDGDIWPSRTPPVLFRPWCDTDVQPNLRICAPIPD